MDKPHTLTPDVRASIGSLLTHLYGVEREDLAAAKRWLSQLVIAVDRGETIAAEAVLGSNVNQALQRNLLLMGVKHALDPGQGLFRVQDAGVLRTTVHAIDECGGDRLELHAVGPADEATEVDLVLRRRA